jgi:beta-glucosidase
MRRFPEGFRWGVATSGHQTEGDNTNSDTWFLEHVRPTVFREPSGPACDGYRRWRDDLDLVAGLGLNTYRFSLEWARIEPREGSFDSSALDHYGAIIDGCRERGLAPVVTFNHFTAPHWFAARGGFLSPEAPELFARYCGVVMDAIGGGIEVAVTQNEPNLARLLSWFGLPDAVRDLERATLVAAAEAAGVPRYRVGNVVLPEEWDALADGMSLAHVAAKAAIKARRPELPVGLSLAMVDDQYVDDPSVRDRKRSEVYGRWLALASEDDFLGVQNYERVVYDGHGPVTPPSSAPRNQMGSAIEPLSLAGAVTYAYEAARVPILVTEHGMASADDTPGRVHRAGPARAAGRGARGHPGARLPALDAARQLRVGVRLRRPVGTVHSGQEDVSSGHRSRALRRTPGSPRRTGSRDGSPARAPAAARRRPAECGEHPGVLGGVGRLALVHRHGDARVHGPHVVDGLGELEPRAVDGDGEHVDLAGRGGERVAGMEERAVVDQVGGVCAARNRAVDARVESTVDVHSGASERQALAGPGDLVGRKLRRRGVGIDDQAGARFAASSAARRGTSMWSGC